MRETEVYDILTGERVATMDSVESASYLIDMSSAAAGKMAQMGTVPRNGWYCTRFPGVTTNRIDYGREFPLVTWDGHELVAYRNISVCARHFGIHDTTVRNCAEKGKPIEHDGKHLAIRFVRHPDPRLKAAKRFKENHEK